MDPYVAGTDLIAWMMKSMDIDDQGIREQIFPNSHADAV